jgi:hypothetical protein
MNRLTITSGALAVAAFAAAPASAQTVSGQVGMNAFVSPRCGSTYAGDSSFSGTISLGELSQTNGTLSPTLASSTGTTPAGEALFTVGCTSAASTVTLSATRLSNPAPTHLETASNDVDYTAQVKIALATGGFATIDYRTAAAAPAATIAPLTDIYANQPNNFSVRAFDLEAENGAASFLVTGSYTSVITITVSPT